MISDEWTTGENAERRMIGTDPLQQACSIRLNAETGRAGVVEGTLQNESTPIIRENTLGKAEVHQDNPSDKSTKESPGDVAAKILREAALKSGMAPEEVDAAIEALKQGAGRQPRDIQRRFKDSVFTDLFSRPRYRQELCVALGHGAGLPEDAFKEVTLRNFFVNGWHNDVGIEVANTLIVLAEEQSEWSDNIVLRLFGYLYQTWVDRIEQMEDHNIYERKAVPLSKPKCYVFYPGPRGGRPDTLRLSELYFDSDVDVELVVHCVYDGKRGDIIDQYFRFVREADRIIREKKPTREALEELIRWCIDNDVLREYMKERGSEVVRIMWGIYDEEHDQNQWGNYRFAAGKREGQEDGKIQALIELGEIYGSSHDKILQDIAAVMKTDMATAEEMYKRYIDKQNAVPAT